MKFTSFGMPNKPKKRVSRKTEKYDYPVFTIHPYPEDTKSRTKFEFNPAAIAALNLGEKPFERRVQFNYEYLLSDNRLFIANTSTLDVGHDIKKNGGFSDKEEYLYIAENIIGFDRTQTHEYKLIQVPTPDNEIPIFELIANFSQEETQEETKEVPEEVPVKEEETENVW